MTNEPFENLPDVLNARQLAEVLHLSKAGAYNLLNSDDFHTLRIGGRKLVMKQDLLLWLKKHTNPHFHVLCPIRPLDENGAWGNKQKREYVLDEWRKTWADMVNAKFAEKGLSCRIDHRTLEEQGIDRLSTIHGGPTVRAMEKKGIPTDVCSYNRMTRSPNSLFRKIKNALERITTIIAELKAEREKYKAPTLAEYLGEYCQVRNEYADQNFGYGVNKAKVGNLEKYADEFAFLQERNIHTVDDLEKYASDKVADNHELNEKQLENKAEIKRLNDLICHAENYKQYKPLVTELNGIRWKGKKNSSKPSTKAS